MSDYEEDYELSCPKCGHCPLHNRDCAEIFCNEGFIDQSDEDPINFMPEESEYLCAECKGTGVEWWCPNCGENLSGKISQMERDEDLPAFTHE